MSNRLVGYKYLGRDMIGATRGMQESIAALRRAGEESRWLRSRVKPEDQRYDEIPTFHHDTR